MTNETEFKIIGEIGQVRIQPGDRLIVTYPKALTVDQRERIAKIVSDIFDGVPVLVLDDGLNILVARKENALQSD